MTEAEKKLAYERKRQKHGTGGWRMNSECLKDVLAKHQKWIDNEDGGEKADLRGADLRGADLRGANLRDADLCDADLDYSSGLPMSHRGLRVNIDDRIAIQMLYHCMNNVMHSKNVSDDFKKSLLSASNCEIANKFHRVDECGTIALCCEDCWDRKMPTPRTAADMAADIRRCAHKDVMTQVDRDMLCDIADQIEGHE